jgi:uncharacterized protein (DUF1330 family)
MSAGLGEAALARSDHGKARKGAQEQNFAFYEVVVISAIKDPGAVSALFPVIGSSALDANGRVLVDATAPSAQSDAASTRLAILAFHDEASAHRWRNSDGFKLVGADLQKSATVNLYESAGIAVDQTPQPEPVTDGSGRASPRKSSAAKNPSDEIPPLPPPKDICKGC